jgi:branched-chain amino acid transport system ATP-binding protein
LSGKILLQLDSVNKSFGGVTAVKELSLSVNEGQIFGLIGPNGAGKTTAFNLIAGNYKPNSGVITFDGNKISGMPSHRISKLGISRTFQTVKPFARMTVLENVTVGALFGRGRSLSVRRARLAAHEILAYVSLDTKSESLASSLTLAEQRRLELARALATAPKLLLLDEVMAGLNFSEISSTLELLKKLRTEKGVALLVIEHIMKAIIELCDNIAVMNYGVKIAEGEAKDVMKNAAVIEAYMGEKKPSSSQAAGDSK